MKKEKKTENIQPQSQSQSQPSNNIAGGGGVGGGGRESFSLLTPFWNIVNYFNHHVMYLNSSKFFAGIIMILINIGSKFITIQFSKSAEEYMKYSISKQLLVFAMAWLGTRDIYTALGLTAVFTILSDYLFNEESALCIVPPDYRVLHKIIAPDTTTPVTETEISAAMAVLDKAKRDKQRKQQQQLLATFNV